VRLRRAPLVPLAIAFAAGVGAEPLLSPTFWWTAWFVAVGATLILVALDRRVPTAIAVVAAVVALGAIRGAPTPLAPHDVVALNRVLCCYPSVEALLANTLGATRAVYAYTAPVHNGLIGRFNRISVAISNRWFRLREKKFRGFRAFVHDLDAVDRTIAAAGFRRVHESRVRGVWQLAVFTRE